jgi:hypothetical protein
MKWLVLLLLVGCESRYRYPCQDPANQSAPACQHPACEADGTCADYLVKHERP